MGPRGRSFLQKRPSANMNCLPDVSPIGADPAAEGADRQVFIDFMGFFEYKEALDKTTVFGTRRVCAGAGKGMALTRSGKILYRWTALFIIFLLCGCVPLEKMDKASGTIEATDYLNSLAGIYEALFQPETGDENIVTLRLYPDGSCFLSEKTIGGPSGGILFSTGRWDHSDFSEGVTLHLKSKTGARRVLQCPRKKGVDSLTCSGAGYGPGGGLTLIKK
jgi:hypothetical protein